MITDRCCIVLEAKNISGDLYFDEQTEEFYRIEEEGTKTYFPNPHFQVLKHIRFMEYWFFKENIPLPVTGASFMASKYSRIIKKPPNFLVHKLETIIEKIDTMTTSFSTPVLNSKDLLNIKNTIVTIQNHFEHPPLCAYYQIPQSKLTKGVICPSCCQSKMEWEKVWK